MGFWSKLLKDVLEERSEHEVDRIWADQLEMKKEDRQTFYDLMRASRETERMKRDASSKKK